MPSFSPAPGPDAGPADVPTRGRHLLDDGMPVALLATGLDRAFRYWRGASGVRFVFSVCDIHGVRTGEPAVVVLASAGSDGSREAVWIGRADHPEFRLARAAAVAAGACEAHVHVAGTPAGARRIVTDLKQAVPTAPLSLSFA